MEILSITIHFVCLSVSLGGTHRKMEPGLTRLINTVSLYAAPQPSLSVGGNWAFSLGDPGGDASR